MRFVHHLCCAGIVLTLCSCGTLSDFVNESYLIESERMLQNKDGSAWIVRESRQNVHTGVAFLQYKAHNYSGTPLCARTWADDIRASGGFKLGGWQLVPNGASTDIGYVNDWHYVGDGESSFKGPNADGTC